MKKTGLMLNIIFAAGLVAPSIQAGVGDDIADFVVDGCNSFVSSIFKAAGKEVGSLLGKQIASDKVDKGLISGHERKILLAAAAVIAASYIWRLSREARRVRRYNAKQHKKRTSHKRVRFAADCK